MQGLLQPAVIEGLIIGLALAGIPAAIALVFFVRARRRAAVEFLQLSATNRRNRAIVDASGEGVLELDAAGRVRFANPSAAKQLGYDADELVGLDYGVLINSDDAPEAGGDVVQRVRYTTDIMRGVGALLRRKDGQRRPVEYKIVPVHEGRNLGTVVAFRDVTERVRTDSLLSDMQTTAKIGGWEYDITTKRTHWTEAVYAIYELPLNSPIDPTKIHQFFNQQDRVALVAASRRAHETGKSGDVQLRMTTTTGREVWVRVIIKAERRGGVTSRLYGTFQDVTDRVTVERQVRETRDFYELTLDAMPTIVSYTDKNLIVTYANKAMADLLGLPRERIIGKSTRELFSESFRNATAAGVGSALRGEASSLTHTDSGVEGAREWQTHFVPEIAIDGEVRGFFSIAYDLTELKRLEARLLQAQKMEAVGQLTGGIAHDFNNLLGVVLGNLQLIERGVAETPSLARKVHTAMRAAVRGADLTRRLLSFARRQILDPTVVDLNRQLLGLNDLMQRTLGESIEVRMVRTPDLWHTRVDAGQFENAILNLAINARDAMTQGGRLTVRTQNTWIDKAFCVEHPQVEPGEYVVVSVSDTGSGIEPEILKRVFEPFFTTKESGKGSGLGLAMVNGFAEQSGGMATIESKPGSGTTVKLYLPRSAEEQSAHEDTIVAKASPGGDETILVVEDDADLRETVVTTLKQLGYQAIAAANADAAIRVLSGSEPIDLLFTDIMMPGGILGPALARRARELRPEINVLFTTGYAESNVLSGATGLGGAEVIYKPYRNEELALRIRFVLDREARVA